jgi:hemerythrin-like domain-containing protein
MGRRVMKPTEQLTEEHNAIKKMLKIMDDISQNARGYKTLLPQHIHKEDDILYPLADERLSQDTQPRSLEGFAKIEKATIGAGMHEELHKTLRHLKVTYLGQSEE